MYDVNKMPNNSLASKISTADFPAVVKSLLKPLEQMRFDFSEQSPTEVRSQIQNLTNEELCGKKAINDSMADCCRSGLLLLHGFLEASHELSQSIHCPEGSYWHGLMHRAEGDFWNSKYWYRRVGSHPAYETISNALPTVEGAVELFAGSQWDPETFVDLCEQATHDSQLITVLNSLPGWNGKLFSIVVHTNRSQFLESVYQFMSRLSAHFRKNGCIFLK